MMMGRRESHEATMVHSSIALLQERFRELQRVKEMREERQILQILTQQQPSSQIFSSNHHFPNKTHHHHHHHHHEFIIPSSSSRSPPPPQVSLTLWPQSQDTQDDQYTRRRLQSPLISSMNSSNYSNHTQSFKDSEYSDSGVDTSLHL
ncbi:uncharacterized protein G2W53_002833 [Senna tora]|uniref:Uncharacterized protein n=1 Tax=Senna tora TaxID=362788 RepID=A0A834X971_9FABA|nr:uncharacterized protein G2W53_002833 [Senna tora]